MKEYSKEEFVRTIGLLSKLFLDKDGLLNMDFSSLLLYGEDNAPLLESALYVAQSLSCSTHSLACQECENCLKFKKGIHPDFILIDGSEETIKKKDIDELTEFFSTTAFETGHVSTYVINHIENITSEAINALLKFLEEPQGEVKAILTTTNRERVLPTILSRVRSIRVLSENIDETIDNYNSDIPLEPYYVLSKLTYSEEKKKNIYDSDEFQLAYDGSISFLNSMAYSLKEAPYVLFKEVGDEIKKQSKKSGFKPDKCYNYFYSTLLCVLNDALNPNSSRPLGDLAYKLSSNRELVSKVILYIEKARAQRSANLNFNLSLGGLALLLEDN